MKVKEESEKAGIKLNTQKMKIRHPAPSAAAASGFSRARLCATHRWQPTRLPAAGILQTRTLEWVAISFPNARKWKVKVKSLSHVRLFAAPWTAAYQAPPSMGFSRQEYWSGVPLFSPFPCPRLILWRLCYFDVYVVIMFRLELEYT